MADLEESGYLERRHVGRRNEYTIRGDAPLRHPVEAHCDIAALLELIVGRKARRSR